MEVQNEKKVPVEYSISACYYCEMAKNIPFLNFGKLLLVEKSVDISRVNSFVFCNVRYSISYVAWLCPSL